MNTGSAFVVQYSGSPVSVVSGTDVSGVPSVANRKLRAALEIR